MKLLCSFSDFKLHGSINNHLTYKIGLLMLNVQDIKDVLITLRGSIYPLLVPS